jgi:hypothetical protein
MADENAVTTPAEGAGDNGDTGGGGSENQTPSGEDKGLGQSLMTGEDGGGDKAGDKSGDDKTDKAKEGDKEATKPAVPEKAEDYKLTFADGVNVDQELLTGYQAKALELGLTTEQAQKLADYYAKNMADLPGKAQEQQLAALKTAKTGWEKEIKARPEFEQELTLTRKALKEFGSAELNEIMDQTLLGSHPVFFDFMVKVGKALAEPEAHGRGGAAAEKPLFDRLWPNMK